MSNEHPQISDWRAQGRDDALQLYDELTAKNEVAKEKIVGVVDSMIDLIDIDRSVAVSERARLRERIVGLRGMVRSTDFAPHPAKVNVLLEASASQED
jgi:hypothetical protein